MPARRNTAMPPTCRQAPEKARPLFTLPWRGRVARSAGWGERHRQRLDRRSGSASLLFLPCVRGERTRSEGRGGGSTSRSSSPSKVHKPHLDEMHGPESLPYRPGRKASRKPADDPQHRQQNLPAHRLPPIRPRIRPLPALHRRRAGASGRVEEAVNWAHPKPNRWRLARKLPLVLLDHNRLFFRSYIKIYF